MKELPLPLAETKKDQVKVANMKHQFITTHSISISFFPIFCLVRVLETNPAWKVTGLNF